MYSSIISPEVTFTEDEDIIEYFSAGQCPALAWELHKLKGWTLCMLSSEPQGSPDYYAHIFVIDSDGAVIDIKGKRTLEDVRNEWYFCGYIHRFFSNAEFEYEIRDWHLSTRFDRDRKAKLWAKIIVELLDEF